jgi:hypothetical protein
MALEATLEHVESGLVVRLLLELEGPAVIHELFEFVRVTTAELLKGRLNLLLLNVVILFVFRATRESLPGQTSLQEVKEDMANGFEIVTAALLNALVRVNGGVAGGSSQVFAVFVGDVFTFRILVALR